MKYSLFLFMSTIIDKVTNLQDWVYILLIIVMVTFLIIRYYYKKDIYDPEPIRLIILAFLLGIISILPSFIFEYIAFLLIGQNLFSVILIAPIIEEYFKYRMVLRISKKDAFDGPLDGLVYGAVVGCGFASIENVLYGIQQLYTTGFLDSIFLTSFRSATEIIGHPLFTGLIGLYIGKHKVQIIKSHRMKLWRSILLHSIWNTNASVSSGYNIAMIFLLVIIYLWIMRRDIKYAFELDKKAYEDGFYDRKKKSKGKLIENWQKYVT